MFLNTFQLSIKCLRRTNVLKVQNFETIIQKKGYKQWIHRKPVAVMNEKIELNDEEKEMKAKPRKFINDDNVLSRRMKPRKRHEPLKKPAQKIETDNTYNDDGTLHITKFEEHERKIASLLMALKSKKARNKFKQIILEGYRLIEDAIKAGVKPEIILFSRVTDAQKLSLPEKGVKLYKVPYHTLQLWSDLSTTPGIIGIFKCPDSFEKDLTADTVPMTIICDNVREPGNMGTILRAAAGVGCDRIILTKGCVDIWESKVLRSAVGAHFRVSMSKSIEWDEIKTLISPYAKIFIADNETTVCSEDKSKNSEPEVDAESTIDNEDKNTSETIKCDKTDEKVDEGGTENTEEIDVKELWSRIPAIPYYAADYTTNEVVLVVGGETEGLSHEALKLAKENGGVRVNIPLQNGVESLNTGMALGIVAFEVKRQFMLHKSSKDA